jgi:1-phosphofructokinase
VVVAGSLPPGAPSSFYLGLLAELCLTGVRLAVDTSGAPLVNALAARPDLVKPNRAELADAANQTVHTLGDVVRAAQVLRRLGARAVLASLGADGAVLVDDDGAVHGEAAVTQPRSAVGAGDAALAGFLSVAGSGGSGPEALRAALAWGAAAVSLPGSGMPEPYHVDLPAVRLHDRIRADHILTERS